MVISSAAAKMATHRISGLHGNEQWTSRFKVSLQRNSLLSPEHQNYIMHNDPVIRECVISYGLWTKLHIYILNLYILTILTFLHIYILHTVSTYKCCLK